MKTNIPFQFRTIARGLKQASLAGLVGVTIASGISDAQSNSESYRRIDPFAKIEMAEKRVALAAQREAAKRPAFPATKASTITESVRQPPEAQYGVWSAPSGKSPDSMTPNSESRFLAMRPPNSGSPMAVDIPQVAAIKEVQEVREVEPMVAPAQPVPVIAPGNVDEFDRVPGPAQVENAVVDVAPEPPQTLEAASEDGCATEADEPLIEGATAVAATDLPTPARNLLRRIASRLAGDEEVYAVGHFSILSLGRDYRNRGRLLSNGIPNLYANGPDEGDFAGVDFGYSRRRGNGHGWEMRLMGFDPDAATDIAGSSPVTAWAGVASPLTAPATPATVGLSGIGLGGFSMADIFDDATNHRVTRDSQFGSFEFNLLRAGAGGKRFACGDSVVEFTGGLRAVTFDETTSFIAGGISNAAFPTTASYISAVENKLFGIQVGGRLERQLAKGFGFNFGTKVGIYNNRVENRQYARYQNADGSVDTPQVLFGANAGQGFDFSGSDNELAFLGELDFGIMYQFSHRARARIGYRGIAVTNIADAAGQFEENLFDTAAVAEPKAWGDLIVGGMYFGMDYAF